MGMGSARSKGKDAARDLHNKAKPGIPRRIAGNHDALMKCCSEHPRKVLPQRIREIGDCCLCGVAEGQPEAAQAHALAVGEDAGAEDAGRKPKQR